MTGTRILIGQIIIVFATIIGALLACPSEVVRQIFYPGRLGSGLIKATR